MLDKKSKGMTIIELLIVMALIGIILAITVPSFSTTIERNKLKNAAESLKSDLQAARIQAVKRSNDVIFTRNLGDDGAWCYGFNDEAAVCDCTQTDPSQANYCDLKIVQGLGYPNTNMDSSSGNSTFRFRRGTVNSGYTCFSSTNYLIKVVTNNSGKVEICSDTTAPFPGYETCVSNCP